MYTFAVFSSSKKLTVKQHWIFPDIIMILLHHIYADMAGDNSTGSDRIAKATTQAAAILDSGWLLAAAIEFYIDYAVIGIGVVGAVANAAVLYALIVHNARETKKRMVNWLIIHQNLLDLSCCIIFVATMSMKVSNIYLQGALGYILCSILAGGNAIYCALNSSVINLMALTTERYLKVIHPVWGKKYLKIWMTYAAIAFSWIAGILSIGPLSFVTSVVADGRCLGFALYWTNVEIKVGHGVWSFLTFFVIPLILFVYCYGHIVMVTRKQARVMAGYNGEGSAQSAAQVQAKRMEWNVIKTMIIVTAFFIVCWAPLSLYTVAVDEIDTSQLVIGYMFVLTLPYINIAVNPFIYTAKHEGVRGVLAGMIVCRKRPNVAAVRAAAAAAAAEGANNPVRIET